MLCIASADAVKRGKMKGKVRSVGRMSKMFATLR